MKLVLALIIGLGLIILYTQCKSSDVLSPELFDKRKITFGSGGGFAGKMTKYCLLENGQLFGKNSNMEEWQSMDTLKKDQVKQYFNQIENLQLLDLHFNNPGNWSYFITIEDGVKQHKIQWSMEQKPAQSNVLSFYNILNEQVKSYPPFKADNPVR